MVFDKLQCMQYAMDFRIRRKDLTMTSRLDPPPGRLANGQFTLGNPGRRAGSRNRASHRVVVMAILNDFERNRIEVLEHLRRKYPVNYFDTLARLTPQLMAGSGDTCHEDWTDSEAAQIVCRARQGWPPHPIRTPPWPGQRPSLTPSGRTPTPSPGAIPRSSFPTRGKVEMAIGAVSTAIYGEIVNVSAGDEWGPTTVSTVNLRWISPPVSGRPGPIPKRHRIHRNRRARKPLAEQARGGEEHTHDRV